MNGGNNGNYQDRDSHQLNIKLSSGIFGGDRIEQINIPRDQEHHSSQVDRFLRRQLELPPMPEFIGVTVLRMAIATFIVSILLEVLHSNTNLTGIWVLTIFMLSVLIFIGIYCLWAIIRQPQLKSGVVHLWICIAFGAVFGIIGGSYV